MKAHYAGLYDDGPLTFDMVTTGHAATSAVRGERNVYMRAGQERVPAGPYANAGRMRAIALAFMFAVAGGVGRVVRPDAAGRPALFARRRA